MPNALVVEDHASTRRGLVEFLESRNFSVTSTPTLRAASAQIERNAFDSVLLDVVLPDGNGLDLLLDLAPNKRPHVLLMSGETHVADTLEKLDLRSLRFLPKPIDPTRLEEALNQIRRSVEKRKPAMELVDRSNRILGNSAALQEALQLVEKVAPTDVAVLIHGETGTGKELIAEAVHAKSHRRRKPLVPLNCGAIPENLIDSELFGYVRGAFTGAQQNRQGAFESANGGTLFLDEITEMPLQLQTRLLRVLETGRVKRVGDTVERAIDVRIVCATNRPPAAAVTEGELREDLFHRLAEFPIHIPPLRNRDDDIGLLARHFFAETGGDPNDFDDDAIALLHDYHWPGNVRQLRNVIHRLHVVAEGRVTRDLVAAHLGDQLTSWTRAAVGGYLGVPVGTTIAKVERRLIEATLDAKKGNKLEAAEDLGISLRTLYNRLHSYRRDKN